MKYQYRYNCNFKLMDNELRGFFKGAGAALIAFAGILLAAAKL
jgi:hypothetical protein